MTSAVLELFSDKAMPPCNFVYGEYPLFVAFCHKEHDVSSLFWDSVAELQCCAS
jgi:hypothetical protein